MRTFGVILCGGIGQRMNSPVPKQYLKIKEKEILSYSIEAFQGSKSLDDFVVVADSEEHRHYIESTYHVKTILGGATRNHSFCNALEYITDNGGCDVVFVNEAARPMITPELIEDMLALMVDDTACVYCVKPVTDSLEKADGTYVNRADYQLVMSPEAYSFEIITKYFSKDSQTTFPGHDIPMSYHRVQYAKYLNNIKITYPVDLTLAGSLLN